jgi:ribosome-associated toxin RatA of RatAB toxin-antitoxin module
MRTRISRLLHAEPEVIFGLAAAVENWPRLLPHYRWVRVVEADGPRRRVVEMAASRLVVGRVALPLRWTAIQTLYPESTRIEFEHIRGISRGMRVTWTIERVHEQTQVEIEHVFTPGWPVPDRVLELVVGEYVVNGVARRTLVHLAGVAQQPS